MSSTVPEQPVHRSRALWPLRPHRQQRHQLPGFLRGGFGLLIGPALLVLPAVGSRAEGYGRWQTEARHCDLKIDHATHDCRGVRLEQNLVGMLSVRFLAEGRDPDVAMEELLFVGELQAGQPAMQCSTAGRCKPSLPTSMTVLTVAGSQYDSRGLIRGLPQTHLARGTCTLNEERLRCEARNAAGAAWVAEAHP